jgi:predicted NBD/HSP70 family sugar kinase
MPAQLIDADIAQHPRTRRQVLVNVIDELASAIDTTFFMLVVDVVVCASAREWYLVAVGGRAPRLARCRSSKPPWRHDGPLSRKISQKSTC